jgi:cystathionine gamma-synthase
VRALPHPSAAAVDDLKAAIAAARLPVRDQGAFARFAGGVTCLLDTKAIGDPMRADPFPYSANPILEDQNAYYTGNVKSLEPGKRGAVASESIESWLVSAGRDRRPGSPLNVPPCPASNFVLGERRAYARDDGTPTWEALEEIVGGLEGGEAVAFASGMAAIAAVFDQLSVGSTVVLPDDCYQGVSGLADTGQARGRWAVRRVAVADTDSWISAAANADLIWLESPSNPLLAVADLPAICAAARKPGSILGVDNTFATPLNQRPLELGADISMQSVTKFIGGHSDLLGGVAAVRNSHLAGALRHARELAGATPGAL